MNPEPLLESATWPVFIANEAGTIRRANAAAVNFFGRQLEHGNVRLEDVWGTSNDLAATEFLAKLKVSHSSIMPLRFRSQETANLQFLGSVCRLERGDLLFQLFPQPPPGKSAAPPGTGGSDKTVEVNLAQKQKLECAMQLTRTVALDFNNALTTILGHVSYVLSKMESSNPWRRSLVEVEKAAERAGEIVQSLETFGTDDKGTRTQIAGNLNALLRRTVELFQTPQNSSVNWSLHLTPKIFSVTYDEAKMQQAFAKIIENAIEAASSGARIVVETRNLELTEATQDRTANLQAGLYVCVEITDNGGGISAEILPRIFEPFFTTKYGHRGLGLALVYGIVTNHGGGVAISSEERHGTSVRVYFPAIKKVVEEKLFHDADLGGSQTILVVDDEDMVLKLGQMILSSFGYRVLLAGSGEEALEIFKNRSSLIDLMITDMVMPKMNGRELIEKVRLLSPATRIICSTACVRPANAADDIDYLEKPFTAQQLLHKVREALAPLESTPTR